MTDVVLAGAGAAVPRDAAVGAVFTKEWVVRLVLDLAGYAAERDLAALHAIEPACGHGAFVGAMVERLLASCEARGTDVVEAVDAIRAYDIDPLAVRATRAVATRVLVRGGVPRKQASALARRWVNEGDFLLPGPGDAVADVVVGNPPYVRLEDVPAVRMAAYRAAWPTMKGRADLYVGFLEAALRALRPDGVVAFICADRWMRNRYGRHLRALVEREFAVDAAVVLHGVDAFERRVSAYPAITVLRRAPQRDALVVDAQPSFGPAGAAAVAELAAHPGRPLPRIAGAQVSWSPGWFHGNESWPAGPPERLALVAALERRFARIDADARTRVGIGVATGADAVFVTDDPGVVEPDRLVPLALARDTASGRLIWSGHYLVSPWDDEGSLVSLAAHPRLARYLRRHSRVLRARHVGKAHPRQWWRTIDKVTPGLAERPKLLLPDLKRHVHPVLDPGGHYPHHNLFYVVSDAWDLEVLGGLLLSDVANAFVEAYSVRMANDCLRVTAQYLRRIRVPEPGQIIPEVAARLRTAFAAYDRNAATEAALEAYGLASRGGL